MKKIYVLLALLMIISFGYAQVNDVALSEEMNPNPENQDAVEAFDAEKTNRFIANYGIIFNNVKFAKALDDIELKEGPFANSEKLGVIVKKGDYLDLYKLLPAENVWAINYQGIWGFVPVLKVMQVTEKKEKTDFTPFDVSPKLKRINLVYPADAERNGIEGRVLMQIHITKEGKVDSAEVVKGVEGLNDAAVKAIMGAKFKPAKFEGEDVDVWINYPIDYFLGN